MNEQEANKCPYCGASIEENAYEDYNEFNEIVTKCASCGYDFGEVD